MLQVADLSGGACASPDLTSKSTTKKGKINTQADALSHLVTTSETIADDDNDYIPVFLLELVNVALEPNKTPDDVDFIDVQYADIDEVYASMDDPTPPATKFHPIGTEKLLRAQLADPFCAELHGKLN